MTNGVFIQRIFLFCGVSVGNINPVIVRLTQDVGGKLGLQSAQSIPQRELIQGKVFEFLHKAAVQQVFSGNFRHLGQRPPLRFGKFLSGAEPGKHGQSCPQDHHHNCR